jgi:Ribbon-helix-helix protein, copG family
MVHAASLRLATLPIAYYTLGMKSLTVRLPEALAAQLAAESRARKISRSDVVRERLALAVRPRRQAAPLEAIADLIGSVDGLPVTLSARTKAYLRATGYGQKRPR